MSDRVEPPERQCRQCGQTTSRVGLDGEVLAHLKQTGDLCLGDAPSSGGISLWAYFRQDVGYRLRRFWGYDHEEVGRNIGMAIGVLVVFGIPLALIIRAAL